MVWYRYQYYRPGEGGLNAGGTGCEDFNILQAVDLTEAKCHS